MKKYLTTLVAVTLMQTPVVMAKTLSFYHQDVNHVVNKIQTTSTHRTKLTQSLVGTHPPTIQTSQTDNEIQFTVIKQHYTKRTDKTHITLQQYYHGIPVLGGKLTAHITGNATLSLDNNSPLLNTLPQQTKIDGRLVTDINISDDDITFYQTEERLNQAVDKAKKVFTTRHQDNFDDNELIIEADKALVITVVDNEAVLAHQVTLQISTNQNDKPRVITIIADAMNPDIVYQVWNNLHQKKHEDTGLGGNSKTSAYIYGEDDMPKLHVNKVNRHCVMENGIVKVVNALERPNNEFYKKAYRYRCGDMNKDLYKHCTNKPWWGDDDMNLDEFDWENGDWNWEIDNEPLKLDFFANKKSIKRKLEHSQSKKNHSGSRFAHEDGNTCMIGYSPANDALVFGELISEMYQEWYNTDLLSHQLVMRVHVGTKMKNGKIEKTMDNAFWHDREKTMNFGDGFRDEMYPLVTLDITAHEVSHGFTSEHSNLSYIKESGALNESYSDMASMAAMDYTRLTQPNFYQKLYHTQELRWMLGSSVFVGPFDGISELQASSEEEEFIINLMDQESFNDPLRYMEQPSQDDASSDCYHQVDGCAITFAEMAQANYEEAELAARLFCPHSEFEMCVDIFAQSGIVHEGSGVFNKAFYLLANSQGWDVRKALDVMLTSNRDGYWVDPGMEQDNYLNQAACGSLYATQDLGYNVKEVLNAFQRVGLLINDEASGVDNSYCELAQS